jgi:dipeptidyl aminopeptidase/acylaminoacyl peptidase
VIFEVSGRGRVRRIAGRDVSVSPDGKLRATVARTAGGLALSLGAGEVPGERVASWKNGRNGKVLLAWSPDSDRLAAVGASSGSVDNGGQVLLYGPGPVWFVRSGGHPARLLGRGLKASWSPRGTRLAVERTNGIDVRRSDGRLLRRIPRARDLAWSADDERSAYRIGRSTVIADGNGKPLHSLAGPPGDIFPTLKWSSAGRALLATYSMGVAGVGEVITSDGATRTPFFGIPLGWNGERPRKAPRNIEQLVTGDSECWPSPSPNGLTVVLSECGQPGVYDAVSGRALLRARVDEPGDDIRWSPNGKQLLQRSGDTLETISFPGGIRRTVATLPGDAGLAWARWLTDDRIAYRVSRHTFPKLHLLELRTLEAIEVGGLDVSTQPFYEDPWWSRGGTLLAARKTALRGSGSTSIVVIGTGRDGSAERGVGAVVSNRGRATWSKDDTEIALIADEDHGVVVARRMSDGSDRTIAEVPGAVDVAWSPDGEQIAVATSRGVVVVRLDRPGEQRYVAPPLETPARRPPIATPTWSPDGTRIAYTGPQGLVVATVDGGAAPAVLVRAAARPSAPTWSPDGQWIVLAANDPACTDRLRLIIVPAAGGAAQHLYRTPDC